MIAMFTTVLLIIGALTVLYWVLSFLAAVVLASGQSNTTTTNTRPDYNDYMRAMREDDY